VKLSDLAVDVDGVALLDQVRTAVGRYVILPSGHVEVAVTLWIAASHAVTALHTAPRLALRSPEKRCGKSRLLDLAGALCRNALPTANVSAAVLYRVMGGDRKPTLIIDEADTVWGSKKTAEQNEDLRGLVNAGFERGRPTLRYDAAARCVEELETFGFVALAGIGALPDTITDRAVNVTMRRRRAGERVEPFRSRRDGPPLRALRDQLGAWVGSRLDQIGKMMPDLPVEDRAADVWEALVIIADVAGGDWPKLAREAAVALTGEQEEEERDSTSMSLLCDIRDIFKAAGVGFLESKDLVVKLRSVEESPWGSEGADLSVVKLSARLRPFGVKPQRNVTGTRRGYRLEDFVDPFARYLGTDYAGGSSIPVNSSKPQANPLDGSSRLTPSSRQTSNAEPALTRQSDDLTGLDDLPPGTCSACGWHVDSTGHASNCAR
jgi:hypothetical protein